ncbi:uncharacterized protein BYT42DRAFT_368213 [Radiomyces spectabilis]|uniref:uncharacterized protein n=1 Tax=Radiomyces spectabilis TaxID=64574 RepID=UPI00222104D5|nr:uncharacterized protein BYT42DRAFT_368213 [Radiomyces spectabilis]KAI8375926.1 hypothetical protein BYT42DRAFT_368213 [Radiomyces spectabilis]
MEGLHNRLKPASHVEDEAEFLDEEEQEKLLQELRVQNDRSNLLIQRWLVVISLLITPIYILFLYNSGTPMITMPMMERHLPAIIFLPKFAAAWNIASIYLAIYLLWTSCHLTVRDLVSFKTVAVHPSPRVDLTMASLTAGATAVAPVLALLARAPWTEVFFWSFPLILIALYAIVYRTMDQVQVHINEVEKARYKYKGA